MGLLVGAGQRRPHGLLRHRLAHRHARHGHPAAAASRSGSATRRRSRASPSTCVDVVIVNRLFGISLAFYYARRPVRGDVVRLRVHRRRPPTAVRRPRPQRLQLSGVRVGASASVRSWPPATLAALRRRHLRRHDRRRRPHVRLEPSCSRRSPLRSSARPASCPAGSTPGARSSPCTSWSPASPACSSWGPELRAAALLRRRPALSLSRCPSSPAADVPGDQDDGIDQMPRYGPRRRTPQVYPGRPRARLGVQTTSVSAGTGAAVVTLARPGAAQRAQPGQAGAGMAAVFTELGADASLRVVSYAAPGTVPSAPALTSRSSRRCA